MTKEQNLHFRFAIKEARSLLTMASELLIEAEMVCEAPANRDYLKKFTDTCEKLRFDLSKKFHL